jgi:hypothetical protein
MVKRGTDPGQQGAVAGRDDDDRTQLGGRVQFQANGARTLSDRSLAPSSTKRAPTAACWSPTDDSPAFSFLPMDICSRGITIFRGPALA